MHGRAAELQRARTAGAAAGADEVGVDRAPAGSRSMGMPVWSLTIIANAVWWPWPCADVPARMVAEPSSWTSTAPYSLAPPPAVIST